MKAEPAEAKNNAPRHQTTCRLSASLGEGDRRITASEQGGADVTQWADFWLVSDYQAVCDAISGLPPHAAELAPRADIGMAV